ncbi:MAG: phospholipid carrier-dependent glycosyltransferase [Candidatus Omnitrophota bacterium]|jgi:4-amino-4-deoxy-L-arabinose transferase-like glycosyltransferase|nr:MAG: phospholipid carrier-dependent glycosyltransferase [Candidatus Omnitrophota bacterium]
MFFNNLIYSRRYLILILGLLFFLRIYLTGLSQLHYDEAYWWLKAQKGLTLGYYDNPPLLAWIIKAFLKLFGDTQFSIRVISQLFFTFSSIMIYLAGKEFSGRPQVGVYSLLIFNFIPGFWLQSLITVPESILVFFILATMFAFFKASSQNKAMWWVLLGICMGLGAMIHYSIILTIASLLMILFFNSRYRAFRKNIYLSLLGLFFVITPNILWIIKHSQTILWICKRIYPGHQFISILRSLSDFTLLQILVLSPGIFMLFLWVLLTAMPKKSDYSSPGEYIMKQFFYLNFSMLSGLSLIRMNALDADWLAQAYLPAIVLASSKIDLLKSKALISVRVFRLIFILILACGIIFSAILSISMINFSFAGKAGLSDIFKDFYGWRELSNEVGEIKQSLFGADPVLVSDNYAILSELAFYLKDRDVFYVSNSKNSHSFNFGLWSKPTGKKSAIFVTDRDIGENQSLTDKFFVSIEHIKTVTVGEADLNSKTFYIYNCLLK